MLGGESVTTITYLFQQRRVFSTISFNTPACDYLAYIGHSKNNNNNNNNSKQYL